MEVHSYGEALKAIMDERSWTQEALAAHLGVSQSWISRVKSGERDPSVSNAAAQLSHVGWELIIRPKREADGVDRRQFNEKALTAAASITLLPSTKVSPYKNPDYLTALGFRLSSLRDERGGIPLVQEAARHFQRISGLAGDRDKRLLSAACLLADQIALVMFHAGKAAYAENAGLFALSLGRQSGDMERTGAAYESLVIMSSRTNAQRAARFARQGIKLREIPDVRKARLQARFAASLSRAQQHSLSMAALDSANSVSLEARDAKAVVDGSTGMVLYRLGRTEEGRESLGKAVQAFEGVHSIHSQWLVQQVKADLLTKRFENAASSMHQLAYAVPLVSDMRFENDLRDLYRLSARWADVPEVAEGREALRDVTPALDNPGRA